MVLLLHRSDSSSPNATTVLGPRFFCLCNLFDKDEDGRNSAKEAILSKSADEALTVGHMELNIDVVNRYIHLLVGLSTVAFRLERIECSAVAG
ncbi:hypothetical protein Aduo_010421 [Ancylostoma duodenale]